MECYRRHRIIEHLWDNSCKCGKLTKDQGDTNDHWKRKMRDHKHCQIYLAEKEAFDINKDYKKPKGFDKALDY